MGNLAEKLNLGTRVLPPSPAGRGGHLLSHDFVTSVVSFGTARYGIKMNKLKTTAAAVAAATTTPL